MKQSNMTTVGSVITSIIASLCCIGPLAAVLLGVGSIGAFSIFETYRPFLIGITILLLGLAFYLTYRKREVICEDGTCKVESAGKWNKIAVWFATFVVGIAIAFPYLGITSSSTANASVVPHASVVLMIDGMDCNACAKGVEGVLASMKGVHQATVSFESGQATIQYDPKLVQPTEFVKRVEETSFTATIVRQSSIYLKLQ